MGLEERTQDVLDPQTLGNLTGHSAICCSLVDMFGAF